VKPRLPFSLAGRRVYVAGHSGMVGSAITRRLAGENCEIIGADHASLDLTNQDATESWFERNRPAVVFLAAARVGGIYANSTYSADFIVDNLAIALNVIRGAHAVGVEKLMFLGSRG
jgi:GDP-L-fucose synthase